MKKYDAIKIPSIDKLKNNESELNEILAKYRSRPNPELYVEEMNLVENDLKWIRVQLAISKHVCELKDIIELKASIKPLKTNNELEYVIGKIRNSIETIMYAREMEPMLVGFDSPLLLEDVTFDLESDLSTLTFDEE